VELSVIKRKTFLQKQLHTNIIRSRSRFSKEVDDHIEPSIAPGCRALCYGIQQHLPRELRDVIYLYLLPQRDVLVERLNLLPLDSLDSLQPNLKDVRHMSNPAFADAVTRYELFEAWYKFRTFKFVINDLVTKFLRKDLWGLDLPVRKLVRDLEIDIRDREWLPDDEVQNDDRCDLLDCLLTIRPGAHLVFPTKVDHVRDEVWERGVIAIEEFVALLSQSFSSAKMLLAAGHRVIVELDRELDKYVTNEDLARAVWLEKFTGKLGLY
jgi:hypothetical protein